MAREPGEPKAEPPRDGDRMVMVCASCLCAQCWHGEHFCEEHRHAATIELPVRALDAIGREHPSCYSAARCANRIGGAAEPEYDDGPMWSGPTATRPAGGAEDTRVASLTEDIAADMNELQVSRCTLDSLLTEDLGSDIEAIAASMVKLAKAVDVIGQSDDARAKEPGR